MIFHFYPGLGGYRHQVQSVGKNNPYLVYSYRGLANRLAGFSDLVQAGNARRLQLRDDRLHFSRASAGNSQKLAIIFPFPSLTTPLTDVILLVMNTSEGSRDEPV